MEHSRSFFARLATALSWIFYQLFGSFSWNSPPWLKRFLRSIRSLFQPHPWRGISLVVLIITCATSFYWYQHRDKPILINAQITAPTGLRDTLTIYFVKPKNRGLSHTSVAPIEQFGKEIDSGIEMTPSIPGKWQWIGDIGLTFTPTDDWPAEQIYQMTFSKTVFNRDIQLQTYRHAFSTQPLAIQVSDLRLYQDLQEPQTQKIFGTLKFNYPIDESSLIEHTSLVMQEIKNDTLDINAEHIPVTITYDSYYKEAYIESAPVKLPSVPRFVNLMVEPGVQAVKGRSKSKSVVTQKLLIPSSDSFLQITDVRASIQRNDREEPEQIFTIETTLGIGSSELLKYLNVYMLPCDCPATAFQPVRKDYPWSKPGEVTPEVFKLATPVQLEPLPEEHPFPTFHQFKFQVKTPSYLYVQISKGLAGFGGFSLANDYKTVVRSPDDAQEIYFLHSGSLLAKSGDKKMTVAVRGIPEVKFSISHVLAQHLNHLVTQTHGDFQNPQFNYWSIGHEEISQIHSEFRHFNVTSPCDLRYTSIDLTQYLENSQNSLGLFLLKAQGWDSKNNAPTEISTDRLLLITDMALIVKDNADETHNLFVQSITEGLPVADAEVTLLGKNSLPIIKAKTDDEGHASFPSMRDFKDDREPTVYLVCKGDDISFIPYQRNDRVLNYSRFDTEGVITQPESRLSAYLFFDRGVYRPGDAIHIGAIVKNQFSQDPATGLPLEFVLTDPQGTTLLNQKMTLPSSHLLSLDYTLPENAMTGQYHVNLYVVKDNQLDSLLGFKSLRVEEFLPDRLKMEAHFSPDTKSGWLSPEGQKATINLWNLFGTPAANHTVKAKMVLTPRQTLYFSQYDNYHFVNPLCEQDSNFFFSENFTDATTDDNGEVEFNLNLDRFAKATYQLDFFAEGFEGGGGRAVSAEISALMTPYKSLVGYKPHGDLYYLKQGSNASVHFIAITPEVKPKALNNLQAKVMSIQTVSTLVKKRDGSYQYQSERQKTIESTQAFEIGVEGNDFILPTHRVGDFTLAIYDADGNLLSEVFFTVTGESPNPVVKNAELTVKLDKKVYQAGDTIEMQISAPYSGAGLVTIERDKVHAYQWFKADSNTSVQKIAIPPDFQGNGYVSIAFVRAWDSDEIYINPLSYATLPFNVSREQQALHIDLTVPEFVRAGEELPIQFSTKQPSKILLFAVDEGILRLDSYQTPDPLAYFFRKSALMVKTSQTADLILPKFTGKREASATGGDRRLKLLALNSNPFKRKAENAVVFWSGIIDSDSSPKTVHYQVPDYFNGSLRVMAVAVAPGQVGNAEKNTQVQSYFIIRPNVPTFVAPGDTVTITAAITNGLKNDDTTTPTSVRIAVSPHFVIQGASEQSLIIPPGQERQAAFQIRAGEALGGAELIFTAAQNDKTSQVHSTVSVRPPAAYQTHLINGYEDSSNKTIKIDRLFYPENRILEAAASPNPLILVYGLEGYLENYPYNHTEKMICRAFTQLIMAKQPFFQLDPQIVKVKFKETLQLLRERQLSSGGFSYWPSWGSGTTSSASILAMDYLTEAKQAGYAVPDDLFSSGIHYLEGFVQKDTGSLSEAREQAYAIYLLTRNGLVTTNYLTNLQLYLSANQKEKWRKDLASAYMASTHKLLQSSQEADRLIDGFQMKTLIDNAQYMILLGRHFPERLKKMRADAMMTLAQGMAGHQLNILSAAYSVQALSAFAQTGSNGTITIREVLEDNRERTLHSTDSKVSFNAEAKGLHFHNPAKETYFYQVNQTGYEMGHPQQPIKNGLEIFREYRDSNNQATQAAQLGNQLVAHIKARSVDQTSIDHVAIVDLFPGGFEVIPNSVKAPCCEYFDVREDRIIFYYSEMSSPSEISYSLRAVNKGDYTIPPIFAQAMYQPRIQARGVAGQITIR